MSLETFRTFEGGDMARRAAKGEQTKAETVTIRLSPKLKYSLELLAREQHRTISAVVEWALESTIRESLTRGIYVPAEEGESEDGIAWKTTEAFHDVPAMDDLWDPLEPDRLIKLALLKPTLLTYDEQRIWKVINGESWFWNDADHSKIEHLELRLVRRLWEQIRETAQGNLSDVELNRLALMRA